MEQALHRRSASRRPRSPWRPAGRTLALQLEPPVDLPGLRHLADGCVARAGAAAACVAASCCTRDAATADGMPSAALRGAASPGRAGTELTSRYLCWLRLDEAPAKLGATGASPAGVSPPRERPANDGRFARSPSSSDGIAGSSRLRLMRTTPRPPSSPRRPRAHAPRRPPSPLLRGTPSGGVARRW